ncbi:MAG: membrane dipeptidase, partial [Candidatus Bathyarchaeia archaeon]
GDGFDERADSGLSYFGLQLIDRMNKLGMMISIAHAGIKTAYDAIENSRDPVMLSHIVTCVSYYHKSRPDELIKACAEKGGIIGIETIAHALPNMKKTIEERRRAGIWDVLDHIDHAVDVAGIDHVCIGSDNPAGVTAERGEPVTEDVSMPVEGRVWYGPRPKIPIAEYARMPSWKAKDPNWPYAVYTEGLNGVAEWQNITRGLISRGYSDQEIAKIVGENALRYIERVIG